MLGLLGLMGAVMAGFMVDALMARDPDDEVAGAEDDPPDEGQEAEAAMALPEAGHPQSDDSADPPAGDMTLRGDARNDILTGEGGDDRIAGNAGNDLLGGRAGADSLDGGAGLDWLRGGEGRDVLGGAAGADDLHGERGRDDLAGGAGDDALAGDGGADALSGGAGDDVLLGGQGADSLEGGAGNDGLQGGLGADLVLGGSGADELDGNEGADRLDGGTLDGAADVLNGGAGDDQLALGAGDWGSGGTGLDVFTLRDIAPGDPLAQITDYDAREDRLLLLYDAALHASPEVSVIGEEGSPDVTLCLDGVPVAQVLGGAGLSAADVDLQAA